MQKNKIPMITKYGIQFERSDKVPNGTLYVSRVKDEVYIEYHKPDHINSRIVFTELKQSDINAIRAIFIEAKAYKEEE